MSGFVGFSETQSSFRPGLSQQLPGKAFNVMQDSHTQVESDTMEEGNN
jgi:hypothetical protein